MHRRRCSTTPSTDSRSRCEPSHLPHITALAKVRVADILLPQARDLAAFNRIARKHFDFVLYDVQSNGIASHRTRLANTHLTARSAATNSRTTASKALP
jgi:hypothetical protein